MTAAVLAKLLAMFVTVGLGWLAGRQAWLGRLHTRPADLEPPPAEPGASARPDADPARVLGNLAFFLFVPALLLRTTARLDLAHMPWRTLFAFFVPVLAVLAVLAGLAWNLTGLGLHPVVDESLATLATAVVPVCLVLIGVTLAAYGVRGQVRGALGLAAVKLLLPAVVPAVAHFGFGLAGLPLAVVVVVVMMAALPAGNNALIFAQRHETLQAEATASIVLSTVAFALTASFWIAVLRLVAPQAGRVTPKIEGAAARRPGLRLDCGATAEDRRLRRRAAAAAAHAPGT